MEENVIHLSNLREQLQSEAQEEYTKLYPKIEWKCQTCCNGWQARPSDRLRGSGCPYCTNRKVKAGFNDLATTNPELVEEWNDDRSIQTFTYGSQTKVEWACHHGHGWHATIHSRAILKRGCPHCSGLYVILGETDLETTSPEIAQQLVSVSAKALSRFSNQKVEWKCTRGHHWKTTVANRSGGSNCPHCFAARQESKIETEINRFLIQSNQLILRRDRKAISPKELDFLLPKSSIAFEVNGDFWHSDYFQLKSKGRGAHRVHQEKYNLCQQEGITLYFIWEWDWKHQQNKIRQSVSQVLAGIESPILQKTIGPQNDIYNKYI
jgi:G:T-mismatch repair DNA endonuclease (very short patch repair protein)